MASRGIELAAQGTHNPGTARDSELSCQRDPNSSFPTTPIEVHLIDTPGVSKDEIWEFIAIQVSDGDSIGVSGLILKVDALKRPIARVDVDRIRLLVVAFHKVDVSVLIEI